MKPDPYLPILDKFQPILTSILLSTCFTASCGWAATATDLDLESLLNSTITSASKYEQKQSTAPATVSVLTREDIRNFGWRTLSEALSSLPGIHTTYDRQYQFLGVRGFGLPGDFNTRILLAINGNRMNDVVYDGAQVGREFPLDLDLVERIEYIMGPGGAIYGQNAMLAVVNVITRNGLQVDGGELMLTGAEPQEQRELAVRWGKRLANGTDLLFSASGMKSDGENLLLHFPGLGLSGSDLVGEATGLDGEKNQQFFTQLSHGAWKFNLIYASRQKADPTGGYFTDPFTAGQFTRDNYLVSQLQYDKSFLDNAVDIQGRLFIGNQRYLGRFSYNNEYKISEGISHWQGSELRFLYRAIANHTLMLGFEGQNNSRADQIDHDELTGITDVNLPSDGYRVGLYFQDEWQLLPNVVTTFGARFDRNNVTGTKASPRVALVWQAQKNTVVKALFGRAWRAPNTYESLYEDGSSILANPHLAGERNDTWELLAKYNLSKNISIRSSYFHWILDDIIQLDKDPLSGIPQYMNGPRVSTDGFELAVTGSWNTGTKLWASVSHQDLSSSDCLPVVNSPDWLAKLSFSNPLPWAAMRIAVEAQYDGRRQTLAGLPAGENWLAHLNVTGITPWQGVAWSVAIRNIFDNRSALPASDTNWQDTLEQEGRLLRLRLDYRF